ncbi:MAG: ABC transporter ATP-binding protein [Microthrixaceae bacterium]
MFSILAFPMRVFGFFLEELPAPSSRWRVDDVLSTVDSPHLEGLGTATDTRPVPGGHGAAVSGPSAPVSVEFRDVHFDYGDGPVLRGVTFRIEPGETVALVGPTGSGKSTLLSLLIRLHEPGSGSILLDGRPVVEMSDRDLAAMASLVFQESFLFATTIRDNVDTIGGGRSRTGAVRAASHDAVGDPTGVLRRSAETARVAGVIDRLPHGWDTVVGERGVTLSGGQRQRIALARALATSPRLLMLDDATSAVDPTVEARILGNLAQHHDRPTVLVVAHRLSTIAMADRVLLLDDGVIVAQGPHRELLADPRYASLARAYERGSGAGGM